MKSRILLLSLLLIASIATYAQSDKTIEEKTMVTELKFEIENIEEMNDFNWEVINEIFKENDADQEITLAFAYANKSGKTSEIRIDNFDFKVKGKTSELESMTSKLKRSFKRLSKFEEKYKN